MTGHAEELLLLPPSLYDVSLASPRSTKWTDQQFEDPDDVCLKAELREVERRKPEPPRLGIVPHGAIVPKNSFGSRTRTQEKARQDSWEAGGQMRESNTKD
jgi:hypothetical protein